MSKSRWPLLVRVEVEFVDACTRGTWSTLEEQRRESRPSRCRSIGYLVERTATHVTVAQSISSASQNVADTMSIPRRAVLSIKKLR
jgi:hypothetical protein